MSVRFYQDDGNCAFCHSSSKIFYSDGRLYCGRCQLGWDGWDHMRSSKRDQDYQESLRCKIDELEAENTRIKHQLARAMKHAGSLWTNWGWRAIEVQQILEGILEDD